MKCSNWFNWVLLFLLICGNSPLFSQCNFKVDAGPDILVCRSGNMTNLNGKITGTPLEFYWTPSTNLSNPKVLNPKVTIYGPESYILVAKGNDNVELIVNGDFSAGNTGFSTDYTLGFMSCYGAGFLDCEGTYGILTNPQLGHTGFAPCPDHTTGSGNMMVLNGAAGLQNVWCQNVNVMPDMDYTLSAWITAVVSASPPILQFYMNGMPIGPVFNASGATCDWQNFKTVFNVGSNTNVEICVINLNMATGGNDFAIDDISLKKICEVRDTVNVDFIDPKAIIETPEPVTCDRPVIALDGSNSSTGKGFKYQWTANPGTIISGDKTLKPTIEGPGVYKLEVCAPIPNCCDIATVEVFGNTKPPIIRAKTVDTLGCGIDFANIFLTTNIANLTYTWTGPNGYGSEDKDIRVDKAGKYYIKVVDEFNCSSFDSVEVFEKPESPKTTIDFKEINCTRDCANLSCTSTIPGSTFLWKGPKGNSKLGDKWTVKDTGQYTITTTTPKGCAKTDTFFVKQSPKRKGALVNFNHLTCLPNNQGDTSFFNTAIEFPNDTFEIEGPGNVIKVDSVHFKLTNAGKYTLIAKGTNGCIDSIPFEILDKRQKPIISLNADTVNCKNITSTLIGKSSDQEIISYWKNSIGDIFNSSTYQTNQAGLYTYFTTNQYGCRDSAIINVVVDTLKEIFILKSDTLTCTKSSNILNATGDTSKIKFQWLGPNGFNTNILHPSINKPGQYILRIQQNNFCNVDYVVNIYEDIQKPQLDAKDGMLSCLVDSIQLQSTIKNFDGSAYWKDDVGNHLNGLNPFIKSSGNYSLIATNKNGCTDSIQIKIDKDIRKPDLSVKPDTINCLKTTINLDANSSFDSLTYIWTGPLGFNSNQKLISINKGGKYSIRIITPQNCFAEQDIIINEDIAKPDLSTTNDTLDCQKTSLNLKYNSNSNIQSQIWTGPNNFNSNLFSPLINEGGNYKLVVTGSNFCTNEISSNILQDTLKPDLFANNDSLNCKKIDAELIAVSTSKNPQFTWTNPNNQLVNTSKLKTNIPGIYKIKVVSSNHCTNELSRIISIDTLLPQVNLKGDTINCVKTQILLNPKSPNKIISYIWTGPNQFTSNNQNEIVNIPGAYHLMVESDNHCSASIQINIAIDSVSPTVNISYDSINCLKKEANIKVSGFQNRYQFSWINLQGQNVSDKLNWKTNKSGKYLLGLQDSVNGCKNIIPIQIIEDSLLIKDLTLQSFASTCGTENGIINSIQIIGGHGSFLYSLEENGVYTDKSKFENLAPGTYEIFVKDKEGCTFSKKFEILNIPFVSTNLIPELDLDLGDQKQILLSINLPPNMIKSIHWAPSLGLSCTDCIDPIINALKDQDYTVTVIDTNGCESISTIFIKVIKPNAWVPNIFSPNGDNINDWFFVQASKTESFKINHFEIYDRWGNRVFQEENSIPNHPEQGWNGQYKSEICEPAVFVYWVELENLIGQKFILKGDVSLVR